MRTNSAAALAATLAAHRGVVTFAQVVASGCDPELPAREVAAGRWQRMCRGVYLAGKGAPTDLQQAWCAQLAGGPGAIVTGGIVCRIGGVADVPALPMAVLVAADTRRDPGSQVRCVRTARMPALAARDDDLRLAETSRAVVDAARSCASLRDVRGLVMAAMNAKHTNCETLRTELEAGPRRGSALARRALDDWSDGARSAPEAEVADALRAEVRARRLPPFLLNPNVYDGAILLGAPDVYVPGCALGGETDSRRHHGGEDDLDATLERHAAFHVAGLQLEHVTPARFRRSPAVWAARFAVIARQRQPLGDPPGLRIEPIGPLQHGRRRRSPTS